MDKIKLNFFALSNQDQEFTIYRYPVLDGATKRGDANYRSRLPSGIDEKWKLYEISWFKRDEYEKYSCHFNLNARLTEAYLFERIKDLLHENEADLLYALPENSKFREVKFTISEYPEGNTQVILYPYYLQPKKTFGFLLEHRFRLNEGQEYDAKAQIRSLSLDNSRRPNVFIYRDKQKQIITFVSQKLIPFLNETPLSIDESFVELATQKLARKSYLVGSEKVSQSQFMGIKNFGPYREITEEVRYLFLFSEATRSLGRDVYLGLTGKLFPGQFPGLNRMFKLPIQKDLVNHYIIESFDRENLDQLNTEIGNLKKSYPNTKIMMIVPLPKGFKGVDGIFDAYGYLKYLALKHAIYCQVVTEDTFFSKGQLKWSVSNIGLQIFSKLGGSPWLVKPAKSNCLILGLGSAHEKVEDRFEKYTAYTVCLDSSGDFKYIEPLSSSDNEQGYLKDLGTSLDNLLRSELEQHYSSVVLHLPYKIKKREIDIIKQVVGTVSKEKSCEVIVLKINTQHRYMGFGDHNSRVPYESSVVTLSNNQFLVWAEGLQDGKEVLHKRVSAPIHVQFLEAPDSWDVKWDCLQDIINLTGANWRGFNSKAQPISISYSRLIANFMKEFSHIDGCTDFSILRAESTAPWFL